MRAVTLFVIASLTFADSSTSCKGKPNPFPPKNSAEQLVKTVKNGKLFIDHSVNPPLRIAHVYGSPYDMGLAAGQLFKGDLDAFSQAVFKYMDDDILTDLPPGMPQWLIDLIDKFGIPGALDLTYEWTKPYSPAHFDEELKGMSDGSGISLQTLRQLNMIPELIKAHCSMVGAWGKAISDGTLYQLRALDWSMTGPFADYPTVTIYHPSEGYNFATLGWMGLIGSLTGYSSANVGICEKVWLHYNGTYFVDGYPWHYLLRDILQFDSDISSALNRIMNAKRTCSIFVGLGDSLTNQFRAMEYSHDILNIYSDQDYPNYEGHPKIDHVVYINKHTQPSVDACLGDFLTEYQGKINADNLILALSLHQTGDNHAAVYDFARNYMYVASASSFTTGDPIVPAYDRQFLRLDLNKLWAEPRP